MAASVRPATMPAMHNIFIKGTLLLTLLLPGVAAAALPPLSEYQTALNAVPDFDRGAVLFAQCTACHGDEGQGLSDGTTPRIAGQHFHVLAKQLIDFRRGKRWDFRMEQRAKSHLGGFQDIADVAFYLSAQERRSDVSSSSSETLAKGASLFASKCAGCHGKQGEGDELEAVPMLAGQHRAYLLRQMYDAVDERRPTLARLHSQPIKSLDFEELVAVADFVSQLGSGN
jgi:cytochrome c553